MREIPEGFIKEMKGLLGEKTHDLIEALNSKPITSVRINRRKPVARFEDAEIVPWCRSGLYLSDRPEFILDPLMHGGAYYVQDASSMIYETVAEILIKNLIDGNQIPLRILDLCAAPGGKTTAMINAVPDGSEITANEYSHKRVNALRENIDRWGYPNVRIFNKDTSFFAEQGEEYDIVAVDAPCSGEGMMRKEEKAREQWSPALVTQCSTLQRRILDNAVKALKPGGYLVYSTCTFNREENECNTEYMQNQLGLLPVDLNLPEEWGIAGGIDTSLPVYRFMPHITKGEGLYLSVCKKPGEWCPSRVRQNSEVKSEIVCVEVNKETALKYLRGESIVLSEETPKGLVTITYMGLPLGEAKNIGTRANNLLPKNRRILKR